MQAAQALIEWLRQDLAQAIVTRDHAVTATTAGDGTASLEFIASDSAKPARFGSPRPGDRDVRYQFDPATHKVSRNDEALPFAAFEKVEFRYVAASTGDRHATREAAATPNCVQYRITAAAPAVLQRSENGLQGDDDRRGRVTLVGSVRIDSQTYRGQYPGWTEHAFEAPEAR